VVSAAQFEISVAIDNQRAVNHATRTIVFNRRRLRADLNIDVLTAPHTGGNSLLFHGRQ